MVYLRKTGHSVPEIARITGRGYGTVFRYVNDVDVLPEYEAILREKQGGSKARSKRKWKSAAEKAESMLAPLTPQSKLCILLGVYWGEGTKRELNIINSDPHLLRVFVNCLQEIGVTRDMLRVTVRIFDDIADAEARSYWASVLGVPEGNILGVNRLKGKKKGKLKYGMCRIRVTKGSEYFKLIMSMIELVKSKL